MRITIDSVSYDAIAAYNWPHKIGYLNGPSAWTREQIADAAVRGELLALVDVLGTTPYAASVLDWERGKLENPDQLRDWVTARNMFRGDAAVLCSRDSLTTVINALQTEPCLIWLIDLTANHEPPKQAPPLGLPENLTLLGVKYATPPNSGGNYDISVLYDDAWHTTEVHHEDLLEVAAGEIEPMTGAGPLAMAAAAAAPGKDPASSSSAAAPAAAAPAAPASSPTIPTGTNMMNPDPFRPSAPVPGSPPAAGSPGSKGFLALPPRPVPAAALSSSPADVPAPSSSSPGRPSTQPSGFQIPAGLLQPPGPTAGPGAPVPPAPATSSSASTGPMAARVTASATPPPTQLISAPAAPAPAAGPPASLGHDEVQAVLLDMRKVATWFRAHGIHHPARLLEEAAATAAEAGSLLQRAGL